MLPARYGRLVHRAGQLIRGGVLGFVLAAGATERGAWGSESSLPPRQGIRGGALDEVEVNGVSVAWRSLEEPKTPESVELRWHVSGETGGRAFQVPTCAGRGAIQLDRKEYVAPDAGPYLLPLSPGEHIVSIRVTVSGYERRIACGEPARVGVPEPLLREGLLRLGFASPYTNGGRAVVFLPAGHDSARPCALLVLLHPWNGSIWTYAAYNELLDEAAKRDVVLLFPSGLGNSLYIGSAEDEVLRALDAVRSVVAVDGSRVSLAGASMGGAGATTIGFHVPDRFASITSFFGDSKYDLGTYVKAILRDEADAHKVNALDVVENARNVPVWLIHGEDDRVSPIAQSEMLARALTTRAFAVRFDRVPGMGHAGALVARFARELVARASEARAPTYPPRVSYRSVRPGDHGAYGVTIERAHAGDAFVDVEGVGADVRVHAAENVRAIALAPGALGVAPGTHVAFDPGAGPVPVSWSPPVGGL